MIRKACLLLLVIAAGVTAWQKPDLSGLLPTAARAGKQANDGYLVVSEQLVRPWRVSAQFNGRPSDMAIDATGRFAALLNGSSVVLLDLASGAELSRVTTKTTSYLGVAFRPGVDEIWASEATRTGPDALLRIPFAKDGKLGQVDRIIMTGHPIPAGLAFTRDGAKLYAALHHANEIVQLDPSTRKVVARWASELAPFALALNSDGSRLYVSNRAGARRPSAKQAPSGDVDLPTDDKGSVLPGSVQIFDTVSGKVESVAAGLAPAGIALSPDGAMLAIANSHSDTVTMLNTKTKGTSTLRLDPDSNLPGLLPNQLVFRGDGQRLYVACGGDNSIAVFNRDGAGMKLTGKIPTGWFPTALAIDTRSTLHIASVKGLGLDERNATGQHNSRVFTGIFSSIPDPTDAQLNAGQREVKLATAPKFTPQGGVAELAKLGIEHVFFLIKENRTYDQVFGDLPRGNNDPKLTMYGREVTPNHHALAEQFVQLDNFYSSGAISFEGHQWLMMGFVSDHVERALQAAPRGYAWNMGDSLTISPAGFFWQDQRRPLKVRLLGPVSEPATPGPNGLMRDINEEQMLSWTQYWEHYQKGTWKSVIGSRCVVPALKPIFDDKFPASSMKITDQIRATAFAERLDDWEKNGTTPNLTIVTMTSDHTEGRNPGSPRPRSMVADNDYALGQMVEKISKSKLWAKSLILVVEDDAQDGVDHVSGRRTVALAIGPHIRRKVLDSNFYTHISMVRTMQDIFGIVPKTRYLANARAMNSVFQKDANLAGYTALKPNVKLDDMNPPASALKGREQWAAVTSSKMNWSELDDVPSDVLNRILWWDAKGFDVPYPATKR